MLNSSETEESQHNEYFDFEQQSRMFKEAQARQQKASKNQGPVGNRLTFGKDSQHQKLGFGEKTKSLGSGGLFDEPPAMIMEEEEGDVMSNKKVHASTGKRKSTVKTEQDSILKLEHTFGDDGSLSMGMLNNADDSRRSESKKIESSIPWNSKADISLSTDSIFNL